MRRYKYDSAGRLDLARPSVFNDIDIGTAGAGKQQKRSHSRCRRGSDPRVTASILHSLSGTTHEVRSPQFGFLIEKNSCADGCFSHCNFYASAKNTAPALNRDSIRARNAECLSNSWMCQCRAALAKICD